MNYFARFGYMTCALYEKLEGDGGSAFRPNNDGCTDQASDFDAMKEGYYGA